MLGPLGFGFARGFGLKDHRNADEVIFHLAGQMGCFQNGVRMPVAQSSAAHDQPMFGKKLVSRRVTD